MICRCVNRDAIATEATTKATMSASRDHYSASSSAKAYDLGIGGHPYILETDGAIINTIAQEAAVKSELNEPYEVLEIGGGTGRVTKKVAISVPSANITMIDTDPVFLEYARQECAGLANVQIIEADILEYEPGKQFHRIFSQGFHHHMDKAKTPAYLKRAFNLLPSGGRFGIGDEVLDKDYQNDEEHRILLTPWYTHVINEAMRSSNMATVEAEWETYVDEIAQNFSEKWPKTPAMRELITGELNQQIVAAAFAGDEEMVNTLSQEMLDRLYRLVKEAGNQEKIFSRGDYKVSFKRLCQEVEVAGFRLDRFLRIGPKPRVGAMYWCDFVKP